MGVSPPVNSGCDGAGEVAPSSIGDFFILTKPGVMRLSVFTGGIGLWIAPVSVHLFSAFFIVLALILGSAGAASLNMWYERDRDALMQRTKQRPLPQGRIEPSDAAAFGVMLSLAGVMIMGLSSNWFAATLLAASILFYLFIYTIWLKPLTSWNIVIGGAAGAFPPVIGWVAATGQVSLEPLALFLLIFLWTPPHFWALALFCSTDYKNAGLPMLPETHGEKATRKQILLYSLPLLPVALLPFFGGAAEGLYAIVALIASGFFLWLAVNVCREKEGQYLQARKLFHGSILYIFVLFLALALDRVVS